MRNKPFLFYSFVILATVVWIANASERGKCIIYFYYSSNLLVIEKAILTFWLATSFKNNSLFEQ